jgi:hypothetical protein
MGHLQPSRAIPSDGSLSPDSCRARQKLLTAESGHKQTPSFRMNAVAVTPGRGSGIRLP